MENSKNQPKLAKRLGSLSVEEKRTFLDSFDQVMVDCDGVIWTLLTPIPGAGEALRCLERLGKHLIYVSNNSVRSVENFKEKLNDLGLQLDESCLVNSVIAITHYLHKIKFTGLIYVIGSFEMRKRLKKEGFNVTFGPDEPLDDTFASLLGVVSDRLLVKAVIFDVEFNYNYAKYMRAEHYLKDPECILIAGATDRNMSLGKGLNFAGPGPFLDMLHSHKPPVVLGKPGDALAEVLKDKYSVQDPKRVLFIGDTLEQDILFGRKNNFQTMLVLTGATNEEKLAANEIVPDYYTASLADLVDIVTDVGYE